MKACTVSLQKPQDIDGVYDRFSNIGNTHGLRIVTHEPGTIPEVVDNGMDIKPGHSTSIGLKMKTMKRLSEPYGR